jgi:glycoprotein endo-alpha-1,2-mannosidase
MLLTALASRAAPGQEAATSAPSPRVHAFYYPWYGNPVTDGRWLHWDHTVILREGGGKPHQPPDDIGASFYPELGLYSSRNPAELAVHMRQVRAAGAGVVVSSWWGRGSPTDECVPLLLEAAAKEGLRVAFHIEPYPGRGASSLREDLAYLVELHGASPGFYRHAAAGSSPRPLVYVYDSYLTPAAEWRTVLAPGTTSSIRGTARDALVIALFVKEGDESFVEEGDFDGCYTYFATDGFTFGSTPRNWPRLAAWARRTGKIFIPSVGPGYDDLRIRPWNGKNQRDRQGGAYYDAMFLAALASDPPFVSVTSFNEWHEGTQIEPATPKEAAGFKYLDYTPLAPDFYLRRTREWVDAYESGLVMTVAGPQSARGLGKSLAHEHVVCDFRGARLETREPLDEEAVSSLMLPRLREVVERGFRGFFDCTPAYIGRHPRVLRRLAEASGLWIVTNTGYYGAAGDKFLPAHVFTETADQLAERWRAEWRDGIEGTGIRPGFIKIGVDPGPLSEVDRKLAVAAARAHLQTGLAIACHTGEGTAALQVLEAVTGEGASAEALIVVHADGIGDGAVRERLAEAGAWVELDGVGGRPTSQHVEMVLALVRRGFALRLLLSHDAGWYESGKPGGAPEKVRPFTALTDQLEPALLEAGLTPDVLRGILEENPASAYRVHVRARGR